MSDDKQLRIVMQATGMYCVVHSLFSALALMARLIAWRFSDQMSGITLTSMRAVIIDPLVYAALLLVPAWVLLAKTDWCARVVADMSRPPDEEEEEEEPVE